MDLPWCSTFYLFISRRHKHQWDLLLAWPLGIEAASEAAALGVVLLPSSSWTARLSPRGGLPAWEGGFDCDWLLLAADCVDSFSTLGFPSLCDAGPTACSVLTLTKDCPMLSSYCCDQQRAECEQSTLRYSLTGSTFTPSNLRPADLVTHLVCTPAARCCTCHCSLQRLAASPVQGCC